MMLCDRKKIKKAGLYTASVLLALTVWQVAASVLGESLILPSPTAVLARLFTVWRAPDFFASLWFSLSRIFLGFFAALAAGTLLAVLAGKLSWLESLLVPYMITVKSVPVASIIVLAYVWFSASALSAFISFLIVLPTVYTTLLGAMKSIDPKMTEMADVFRLPFGRRLLAVYLPHIKPYFLSAASLAAGLAWKSGVAAEIISVPPRGSIGDMIYNAKLALETADLFAYTVIIVLLSIAFEKLFCLFLRMGFDALSRAPLRPLKKESAKAKSARAVCAEGISKSYGEKTVLHDLSVCFEGGKAACLMGPSGCGKTTFLRLLGGLESVDDGVINGADGEKAMVFQEDRLVEVMNAVQNAMLGRCDVTKEEAQALLSELGLAEDLKKPAHALSGGMRRRVAIARALLSHAPLLLLDEAFKGLDGETKKTVVDAVRRYTSGKTLIAVTHDAEDAALLGADIFPMPLLQM